MDGLRFKHLNNINFITDFVLNISEAQVISCLRQLRQALSGSSGLGFIYVDGYDIDVYVKSISSFEIGVMVAFGEKSKPIGRFVYNRYAGADMLSGIRKAIREIEEEL